MDGKVNRRVDCLVHLLLKYEVDMFFNRKTKDLMWKYNRREAREKERHNSGMKIDHEEFEVIMILFQTVLSHRLLIRINILDDVY